MIHFNIIFFRLLFMRHSNLYWFSHLNSNALNVFLIKYNYIQSASICMHKNISQYAITRAKKVRKFYPFARASIKQHTKKTQKEPHDSFKIIIMLHYNLCLMIGFSFEELYEGTQAYKRPKYRLRIKFDRLRQVRYRCTHRTHFFIKNISFFCQYTLADVLVCRKGSSRSSNLFSIFIQSTIRELIHITLA